MFKTFKVAQEGEHAEFGALPVELARLEMAFESVFPLIYRSNHLSKLILIIQQAYKYTEL